MKYGMPRVTFVLPAYNAQATLPETVASLINQTMQDWNAVIVDDGSTDCTRAMAKAVRTKRVRVVSQKNRGLAGARNAGLAAMGEDLAEFVSFLDSDDVIAPEFAAEMLAGIGEFDAAACAYEMMGPKGEDLGWVVRPGAQDASIERLIETNAFAVTGLYRSEALLRLAAGGGVFDQSLRVLEDWDLWLRGAAAGMRWARPVDRALFKYRLMPGLSRNIELMWTTGQKVISRAAAPEGLKPRALRRWTLRNAARALANSESVLAARMVAEVGELRDEDFTIMAESLMPAFQRAEFVGPREAHRHRARWRRFVEQDLLDQPWRERLLARFDAIQTDWAAVAAQVASQLRPGEIPTVYGMGWNGRSLLVELVAAMPGIEIEWMDDSAGAAAPGVRSRRVRFEDLSARHAVVVTPNNPGAMLSRLEHCAARVVWPVVARARAA